MKSDIGSFDQDENPYQVMGLASTVTEEEIRRVYFKLVREHPPERDPDQFKRIRAAYEILRDPARRAEWDLFVALQPPAALPSRRRPKPDLTFHREDVIWMLREEIESSLRNFKKDFRPVELPTLQGQR
jgi:curved DNA-binding protein CbpA